MQLKAGISKEAEMKRDVNSDHHYDKLFICYTQKTETVKTPRNYRGFQFFNFQNLILLTWKK